MSLGLTRNLRKVFPLTPALSPIGGEGEQVLFSILMVRSAHPTQNFSEQVKESRKHPARTRERTHGH